MSQDFVKMNFVPVLKPILELTLGYKIMSRTLFPYSVGGEFEKITKYHLSHLFVHARFLHRNTKSAKNEQ